MSSDAAPTPTSTMGLLISERQESLEAVAAYRKEDVARAVCSRLDAYVSRTARTLRTNAAGQKGFSINEAFAARASVSLIACSW